MLPAKVLVEFKVIAVMEGKMPSRVTSFVYEVQENIPLKNKNEEMVRRPEFERD